MEGLLELDRIGKLIAGKYRLELVLGRGGMGTVYRATHAWTGRPVAVKYLHPDHAQDTASVARFLREARAAASVRHPNAVDVLDMGQDTDGSAYLVLELLEGGTLAQYLAANGKLGAKDAVRLLVPVLEALEELHRAGVVHRDVKPANIFLARASRGGVVPKLLDFGVAKMLDESAGLATTTGIVVGTPAYMAPEQAAGNGEVGPWTDVWAVGAVLYEGLAGELPFAAPTPSLMLVNVMTKPAAPLQSKRPDLSAELCAVVDRALTRDVKERFSSAAAMADALASAAELDPSVLAGVGVTLDLPKAREPLAPSPPSLPAAPDATTVAVVTPKPSGRLLQEPAAGAIQEGAGERKNWAEPNATGRLPAGQRPARRSWPLAAAAILLLAGAGWLWRGREPSGTTPQQGASSEATPSTAEPPAPRVITAEPGSAAPAAGPVAVEEPQKPALAAQPGPDAGLSGPGSAPTPGLPEGREADAAPAREARKSRARRAPRTGVSRAPVTPPVVPEAPRNPPSEGAAPPRVEREW